MGWTTPRTWATSEVVTAAMMNAHVRDNLNALNGYVRKTSDTARTSTATLANDPELALAIGGAGSYTFDVYCLITSAANAAGDIQFGFTYPSGTLYWGAMGLDETLASGSAGQMRAKSDTDAASPTTSSFPFGASTTVDTLVWIHGLLVATGSGTLQFQWAQAASNANSTTLKTGSHLTMQQRA